VPIGKQQHSKYDRWIHLLIVCLVMAPFVVPFLYWFVSFEDWRYAAGLNELRRGNLESARATFARIAERDSSHGAACYRLAKIFYRKHDFPAALREIEKAERRARPRQLRPFLSQKADILTAMDRGAEAVEAFVPLVTETTLPRDYRSLSMGELQEFANDPTERQYLNGVAYYSGLAKTDLEQARKVIESNMVMGW